MLCFRWSSTFRRFPLSPEDRLKAGLQQNSRVVPKQNRVTPFGEIVAVPERGTLMGNRGVLHDDRGTIRRPWQLRRWILCVLEFKNRKRSVMSPGCYTELFFLDEATGLAAGHRPCAECQRPRFREFCAGDG